MALTAFLFLSLYLLSVVVCGSLKARLVKD